MALGDMLRLVGGVILASRPSPRPLVSLYGPFDFPRIGLRAVGGVRRFCQLISCDIPWLRRLIVSFPFSSRLSSRLFVSYGVSCLFFAVRFSSRFCSSIRQHLASRLARRSVFLSLIACLVRRSLMSCLCVSSRRRLVVPVSLARLVKQSVFSRFAGRFVSTARRAGRALSVSRLILFCSRIISLVAFHGHGDGQRLVLPLPRCCVFLSLLPSVIVVGADGGNGRAVRRYGGTRRFIQLVFPIKAGNEMTMMI